MERKGAMPLPDAMRQIDCLPRCMPKFPFGPVSVMVEPVRQFLRKVEATPPSISRTTMSMCLRSLGEEAMENGRSMSSAPAGIFKTIYWPD